MSTLTRGSLRATPFTLTTSLTLDEMSSALSSVRPNRDTVSRGWGSIEDDDDLIGIPNTQPPATAPTIVDAVEGRHPTTLAARLYWYRLNRKLRLAVGTAADAALYHDLAAADVLISAIDQAQGTYLVIASTTTPAELQGEIVPALTSALGRADEKLLVQTATSPLDLENADFFLWLLHRTMDDEKLTADLTLVDMQSIRTRDPLRHATSMSEGLDPSRMELLALVAGQDVSFGPAKFSIHHDKIGLDTTLELYVTGAFAIVFQATHYRLAEGEQIDAVAQRLNMVFDVAHTLIPTLRQRYTDDTAWALHERAEFRDACRELIAQRSAENPQS